MHKDKTIRTCTLVWMAGSCYLSAVNLLFRPPPVCGPYPNPIHVMHHASVRRLCLSAAAYCLLASLLSAQSTVSATPAKEPVYLLDPFTITSGQDEGYSAKASAAGLGFVVDIEKLPIPINILTARFLQDSGNLTVQDATRYVSGISFSRNTKAEGFFLRGFDTSNLLRNGERFNTPTDTTLIERVEVIKGPAAIIYGTTDPAGLINIVTKRPSFTPMTSVVTNWDEYGTLRGSIDYNTPLATTGEWKGAARLILTASHDSFPRANEFRDRHIISPFLHLEYGQKTSLDVSAHFTRENGKLNRIQEPWRRTADDSITVDGVRYTGIFADGIVPVARNFTFVTANDDWDLRSKGYDMQLVQHINDNLHFQLTFADSDIDRVQYFNLGSGRIRANTAGEYLAGGFRMVVEPAQVNHRGIAGKLLYDFETGPAKHKLTVGYRYNKDRNYEWAFYDGRVTTDTPPMVIYDNNGAKPAPVFKGAPQSVFSLSDPNAVALSGTTGATNPNPVVIRTVYATDYISLMEDKLHLLLGASYIKIATQDKSAVAPQVGLTYELRPGWNAYALYSKSYSPNGPASTLNPALGFVDPEEGEGKEIGLKFNAKDGKLTGTLAIFDITRQNIVQFLGGGLFTQNNNIPSGEEVSKGVELDFTYNPIKGLSLMGGYAYTDAYISKFKITAPSDDQNNDGIADTIGLKKEMVAKHDIRLWASYDFAPDTSMAGFSVGGGLTWRQGPIKQFAAYIQRFVEEKSDPTRLDLYAAYRFKIGKHNTRLQANWQNAANAFYMDRRGYFVAPSTFSLTAEVRF
jgi:iron complex outermembrane recepter protein